MARPRVAFVTYRGLPQLNDDDRLATAALADIGLRTDAVCWDDAAVDWSAYAAVVVRSTWDYQHHLAEFHQWIDRLETLRARLWNPPAMLRWNSDKRYLARLSSSRLRPPPTDIVERGSIVDLGALLESRGWDEAVIKPAVSADGFSTERTSRRQATADQALLDTMLGRGDVIVQQLVPEIRRHGEISMMFFGGVFSHAVGKRPKTGEFRVQERLGGIIAPTDPPPALIAEARELLEAHASGYLYGRVDVVVTADRVVLMEIELLEPSLYLGHCPASAASLARAIQRIT